MLEEIPEYKRIVSRIRIQKITTIASFAVVAAITVVMLGGFHYYNGIEEKGIGLSLHPLIIFSLLMLEGICAVILYSKAEKSAERIIDVECDPLLYLQVRKAFMTRRDQERTLPIIEARVSYYLGDFLKSERIASRVSEFSGIADRLYGLSFVAVNAFFLEDGETFESSLLKFDRLLERSGLNYRSPIRRDMDRRQNVLKTLSYCLKDDREKAVSYANSLLIEDDITVIEKLNLFYLRAIVYEKFGENKKAKECYEKCYEIKNKTFIAERLNNK